MNIQDPDDIDLLDTLLEEEGIERKSEISSSRRQQIDRAPLSHQQRRLWFLDQLDGSAANFHLSGSLKLTGEVSAERLKNALHRVCQRHEILRTLFRSDSGEPYQHILSEPHFDFREEPLENSHKPIEEQIATFSQTPFDLSRGPLLRMRLWRIGNQQSILYITLHHILCDGWSIGIFLREIAEAYRTRNDPMDWKELPLQYGDYSFQQQSTATQKQLSEKIQEVAVRLKEIEPLQLPTDRIRSPVSLKQQAGSIRFNLDAFLTRRLRAFAEKQNASLPMCLISIWGALLARYARQDHFAIGLATASRSRPELEGLIGFFVSMLPVPFHISSDTSLRDLTASVRDAALQAYSCEDVPFEMLVDRLNPRRHLNMHPIFQVCLAYQNFPTNPLELPGVKVEPFYEDQSVRFDLELVIREENDECRGQFIYDTQLFAKTTVEGMSRSLVYLLDESLRHPTKALCSLPLLSDEEQTLEVKRLNPANHTFPDGGCIHDAFLKTASRRQKHTALSDETTRLTYAELNTKSNRLARYLQQQGVKEHDCIGIWMDRSTEMIIAILAILKCGAAYVPIDPAYPQDRVSYILKDSCAKAFLTNRDDLHFSGATIHTSRDQQQINAMDGSALTNATISPHDPAYIIYTSGSTGQPKGCVVTHHNVIRLMNATDSWFHFCERDVWTLFHSIAFDFSVWEIWGALLYGGRLVIVPQWMARSPEAFYGLLCDEKVTILNQTPSAFRQFIQADEDLDRSGELALRTVIFGGEALELQCLKPWFERHGDEFPRLINMYGITETTVHVTYRPITIPDLLSERPSVIGIPIPDLEIFLLDPGLNQVPPGMPGEICVSGAGVAAGYLNKPELTAQRFIAHPFTKNGGRLYRSGDLGRITGDEELEYLGRMDHQVKVRGFRIELGEIESQLCKHPAVKETIALLHDYHEGDRRIIAYIVTDSPLEDQELHLHLREHLSASLPEYMLPSAIIRLDRIPLTVNGKVDRAALPLSGKKNFRTEKHQADEPFTGEAGKLAAIWCELLNIPQVGMNDNFFSLGGHSLLAVRLIAKIREQFQKSLPLRALFEKPLFRSVLALLDASTEQASEASIPCADRTSSLPLSFSQQRLWFLEKLHPGLPTYNNPQALHLRGTLNPVALQKALDQLIERHEILRTVFREQNGIPEQVVQPIAPFQLETIDLCQDPNFASTLNIYKEKACRKSFDLTHGPLVHGQLIQLSENEWVFLVAMHHIISDGWSLQIFAHELTALYDGTPLAPLTVQYSDFSAWQRAKAPSRMEKGLLFWKDHLAQAPRLLEFPTDFPRPPMPSGRGKIKLRKVKGEASRILIEHGRRTHATPFMVFLTAYAIWLARLTGESNLVIGTPVANREHPSIHSLIGFFVNTLALHLKISPSTSFEQLLQSTRETVLHGFEHQDYPFERLVDDLKLERNPGHSPVFQTMLVHREAKTPLPTLHGLQVTPEPLGDEVAKFDLTLLTEECESGMIYCFEYNTDIFAPATIDRFLDSWEALLSALSANPRLPISRLPLIPPEKAALFLNDFQTPSVSDEVGTMHGLLERQAQQSPHAIAIEHGSLSISYQELHSRANQWAHMLIRKKLPPEGRVGICLSKSVDMVAAIFGILKVGGTYVPLDPANPADRLSWILSDCCADYVITSEKDSHVLHSVDPRHILSLEKLKDELESQPDSNPPLHVSPYQLAYIIYTSGSTGRPKGAMLEHAGVWHLAHSEADRYGMTSCDRILQLATISFDASVSEMINAFANGGTLILPDYEQTLPGPGFMDLIQKQRITWVTVRTSFMASMEPISLPSLTTLLFAGESAMPELCRKWHAPHRTIFNAYGPTEATVCVSAFKMESNFNKSSVPIGKPLAGDRFYILDEGFNLLPIGVAGELFIGGDKLSRGYWQQPELTAEKFLPDPFSQKPGARMYRTGDIVRWLPSGDVEYIQRRDFQVKIRGYRIELGEIEAALGKVPGVGSAVAITHKNSRGEQEIIAYVVDQTHGELDPVAIRREIESILPRYMIPAEFILVKELPLASSGKVDRKRLAPPTGHRETHTIILPRTPEELSMAAIWSAVLDQELISVRDDFFSLGGHSLLAVKLAAEIEKRMNVRIPIAAIFSHPTIETLTRYWQEQNATSSSESTSLIVPIRQTGNQFPIYFFHQAGGYVFSYFKLAAKLSIQSPLFAIQDAGLIDGMEAPLSMEGMAAQYGVAILAHRRNDRNPIFLAGHSLGGLLALETTRWLEAQNLPVQKILMIDSHPPLETTEATSVDFTGALHFAVHQAAHYMGAAIHLERHELESIGDESKQIQHAAKCIATTGVLQPDDASRYLQTLLKVYLKNIHAIQKFKPQVFQGKVHLWATKSLKEIFPHDSFYGWSGILTGELQIEDAPGDHFSILTDPAVTTLAGRIETLLNETQEMKWN